MRKAPTSKPPSSAQIGKIGWIGIVIIGIMVIGVQGMNMEMKVSKGQQVCFEDFLSSENIVTYGFSPFQASSIEELVSKNPGSSSTYGGGYNSGTSTQSSSDEVNGNKNRRTRRILQRGGRKSDNYASRYGDYEDEDPYITRSKSQKGSKAQRAYDYDDDDYPDDEDDYRRSAGRRGGRRSQDIDDMDPEYEMSQRRRTKKKGKAVSQELTPEEAKQMSDEVGTPMDTPEIALEKSRAAKRTAKAIGTLVIKNKAGTVLSPSEVKPYTLYKLSIEEALDVLEICYTNTADSDTLIRIFYTVHRRTATELLMPTKQDSDQLLEKIRKVEKVFGDFLYSYQQLNIMEEQFVTSSSSILNNFMLFGQVLLGAYLLVGWLLRITVERTMKYKKII